MKVARIHNFGGPEVIVLEDVPRPMPATGDVLVRVAAAGVAPWDALEMSLPSALFRHLSWTSHPDDYGPSGYSIPSITSPKGQKRCIT